MNQHCGSVRLRYEPRDQFKPFHWRRQRWSVIVAHRRAGKTVATISDLIWRALRENKRDGRYAFVAPFHNQAKDLAWTYLKYYTSSIVAEVPREAELSVLLLNGARIRLYGGDNPDRLRGIYLDGVVLDEYGDMIPSLWTDVLRPALSDRKGWATFIGTPKGKNAFWELWAGDGKKWPGAINLPKEWFTVMLKASETGILERAELADALSQMGEDQYQQEYECSFEAAIKGAFYAEEMRVMMAEGRIRSLENDPNPDEFAGPGSSPRTLAGVRVHTAWDLGITDSTAIWFVQAVGRERRLIDYYEASGVGLDHYVQVLHDKRMKYGWKYGDHYFPHDIKVKEFTSGRSRIQALNSMGIEAQIVPDHSVLDGIEAVRKMLGRTWIDADRCGRGIEALRQYRREYDERLKDWKKSPRHDWSSHGADALRYFAVGFDDTRVQSAPSGRHRESRSSGVTAWSA